MPTLPTLCRGCSNKNRGSLGLAAFVVLLWAGAVAAEAPKQQDAASQQLLRKAQGMLRQISQEKAALETEKATLAERVRQLEARVKLLEPLQAEVDRHKAAAEALKGANSGLESRLGQARDTEQKLHHKLQDTVATAKKIQGDNQLLVGAVREREDWIAQCRGKNQSLLTASGELVKKYRDKSFWDAMAELEPLTGIGEVRAENADQEYRFKLQDLAVTPYQSDKPTGLAETGTAQGNSVTPAAAPDEEEE
jgi:hypothetical protein